MRNLGEQLQVLCMWLKRPWQIWSLSFVQRVEEGRRELGGPEAQDIAQMPCRCLRAVFFPSLNEGLKKSAETIL